MLCTYWTKYCRKPTRLKVKNDPSATARCPYLTSVFQKTGNGWTNEQMDGQFANIMPHLSLRQRHKSNSYSSTVQDPYQGCVLFSITLAARVSVCRMVHCHSHCQRSSLPGSLASCSSSSSTSKPSPTSDT